jgi:hypothetical protein
VTLILDPALALIAWAHFAPPISDGFRRSYRLLLRWNDELPFVKFSIGEDERPLLTAELPVAGLDRDALGLALARLLAVADRLHAQAAPWLTAGGWRPIRPGAARDAGAALLARYAGELAELLEPATSGAIDPVADAVDGDRSTTTPTRPATTPKRRRRRRPMTAATPPTGPRPAGVPASRVARRRSGRVRRRRRSSSACSRRSRGGPALQARRRTRPHARHRRPYTVLPASTASTSRCRSSSATTGERPHAQVLLTMRPRGPRRDRPVRSRAPRARRSGSRDG